MRSGDHVEEFTFTYVGYSFLSRLTGSDAANTARPREFFRCSQFWHAFVLSPSFHLLDLLLAAARLFLPVSCTPCYDLCIGGSLLSSLDCSHAFPNMNTVQASALEPQPGGERRVWDAHCRSRGRYATLVIRALLRPACYASLNRELSPVPKCLLLQDPLYARNLQVERHLSAQLRLSLMLAKIVSFGCVIWRFSCL